MLPDREYLPTPADEIDLPLTHLHLYSLKRIECQNYMLFAISPRSYCEYLAFFIQVFVRSYLCTAREVSGKATTIEDVETSIKGDAFKNEAYISQACALQRVGKDCISIFSR